MAAFRCRQALAVMAELIRTLPPGGDLKAPAHSLRILQATALELAIKVNMWLPLQGLGFNDEIQSSAFYATTFYCSSFFVQFTSTCSDRASFGLMSRLE